jgi:hypothetical protein
LLLTSCLRRSRRRCGPCLLSCALCLHQPAQDQQQQPTAEHCRCVMHHL